MLLCAIESGLLLSYMVVNDPGWSRNPSQFALQRHPTLSKQKQGPAVLCGHQSQEGKWQVSMCVCRE